MFKYMKVSFNMLISQMQSFLALSYNAWGKKIRRASLHSQLLRYAQEQRAQSAPLCMHITPMRSIIECDNVK